MEENRILDAIIANNNAIAALASTMNEKFEAMDARFEAMENDITKIKVTLEHDVANNISALHDGFVQNNSRLDRIDKHLDNLSIPISDLNLYRRVGKIDDRLDDHIQNHG